MKITILGSGTSSGVPRIGNDWGDCDPTEPRNRRTRASALIEHDGTRILIDTSPDMREQLLATDIDRVDAILWTHDHADHCHGIDDVRQLFHATGTPVRGYARPFTLAALDARFTYAFHGRPGYPPTIAGEITGPAVDRRDRHPRHRPAAWQHPRRWPTVRCGRHLDRICDRFQRDDR
jgi:phosphoribosyl 1,2-cyclic phosphate phosphodiesterase